MTDYNVRLIIKKEGIDILKNSLKEADINDILSNTDIKRIVDDLVYIGWSKLNSENLLSLKKCLFDVGYNDITYRMISIGEDITDIQEEYFTSYEDKSVNIPFPSLIRTFDENDMEQQLKGYVNSTKETIEF